MKQFKITASSSSKIMAYPAKTELPTGAITYLHQWVKEQLYSRRKEFSSKQTEKGNVSETDAINLASEHYGWGMVSKNEQRFFNEHMEGTPDVVLADEIPDIKCSWDCFTFPLFEDKAWEDYKWNMQVYMALTGKSKASLIYCLMDAPEQIVEGEARKQMYKMGMEELDADFYDQVKASMTYSNLPIDLRIKRFELYRDDIAIKQIEQRVELCREYISGLRSLSNVVLSENMPADKITLFKIA